MSTFDEKLRDELQIRALLERYTNAVNVRDWKTYRACWATDAVWHLEEPLNGKYEGIEAIMAEVDKTVESLELFIQMTHSVTVTDLTERTAKAVVTLNEIGRPFKDNGFPFPGMFILAMYFDDLEKRDGGWVFARRVYKVASWDASELKADVYQQHWVNQPKAATA